MEEKEWNWKMLLQGPTNPTPAKCWPPQVTQVGRDYNIHTLCNVDDPDYGLPMVTSYYVYPDGSAVVRRGEDGEDPYYTLSDEDYYTVFGDVPRVEHYAPGEWCVLLTRHGGRGVAVEPRHSDEA
jgi:hypothetical protein